MSSEKAVPPGTKKPTPSVNAFSQPYANPKQHSMSATPALPVSPVLPADSQGFAGLGPSAGAQSPLPIKHERHALTTISSLDTIEEIQLRIANAAMEIRAERADSMCVALRPDARTEMTIHLKLHSGLVDVKAQMQQGNFQKLQGLWKPLQHILSLQGIRLASLRGQKHSPIRRQPGTTGSEQFNPTPHNAETTSEPVSEDASQAFNFQPTPSSALSLYRDSTSSFWKSWS
jgi:hypothetical protein